MEELLPLFPVRENLQRVLSESAAWSDETFQEATPKSIATHLAREAKELAENPSDPMEMADVLLLLAHLSSRIGVDLALACRLKLEINKKRQWGKVDADGVVEHVREEEKADEVTNEDRHLYYPPSIPIFELDDNGRPTGRYAVYIRAGDGQISWSTNNNANIQTEGVRYLRTTDSAHYKRGDIREAEGGVGVDNSLHQP